MMMSPPLTTRRFSRCAQVWRPPRGRHDDHHGAERMTNARDCFIPRTSLQPPSAAEHDQFSGWQAMRTCCSRWITCIAVASSSSSYHRILLPPCRRHVHHSPVLRKFQCGEEHASTAGWLRQSCLIPATSRLRRVGRSSSRFEGRSGMYLTASHRAAKSPACASSTPCASTPCVGSVRSRRISAATRVRFRCLRQRTRGRRRCARSTTIRSSRSARRSPPSRRRRQRRRPRAG